MVTSSNFYEQTNSDFLITNKNNSFSISIPGDWRIPNYLHEGKTDKLKVLLKFLSENDIELHVEKFKKKRDSNEK